uniref:Uncharacterized protein n=1 Tax=Knipowitschia caucasica TaxID=637954 RepID=A0AAV2MBA7_KNICA
MRQTRELQTAGQDPSPPPLYPQSCSPRTPRTPWNPYAARQEPSTELLHSGGLVVAERRRPIAAGLGVACQCGIQPILSLLYPPSPPPSLRPAMSSVTKPLINPSRAARV